MRQARVRNQTKATKTYRSREIELNERALAVLTRQLALSFTTASGVPGAPGAPGTPSPIEGFVFLDGKSGKGFQGDRVQREHYWYPLLDSLNIRRRPAYNTRHTFATLALLAGADPMWVSRQLGHANMKLLLETYSRWMDRSDAGRNRDKLNALFSAAPVVPQLFTEMRAKTNQINAFA